MISKLVHKPCCLILAQLVLALYSARQATSQPVSNDQLHSSDSFPYDSLFPTSKEDYNAGVEYLEALKNRVDFATNPVKEYSIQDKQAKRTWGRNSMNVWGKRNQAEKERNWRRRNLDDLIGRFEAGQVDDSQSDKQISPLTHSSAEDKGLHAVKRGWTPKHEDSRWIEYNYLRRAKMAPQWGRNNMHVWG